MRKGSPYETVIECAIGQLYGPSVGTESPSDLHNFITKLDSLLPTRGIIALKDAPCLSHQAILSALAARGLSPSLDISPTPDDTTGDLLYHLLEEFRSANIHSLSLTETLRNDARTDLPATDTLIGSSPSSF